MKSKLHPLDAVRRRKSPRRGYYLQTRFKELANDPHLTEQEESELQYLEDYLVWKKRRDQEAAQIFRPEPQTPEPVEVVTTDAIGTTPA